MLKECYVNLIGYFPKLAVTLMVLSIALVAAVTSLKSCPRSIRHDFVDWHEMDGSVEDAGVTLSRSYLARVLYSLKVWTQQSSAVIELAEFSNGSN
jgi:hypothetical protein